MEKLKKSGRITLIVLSLLFIVGLIMAFGDNSGEVITVGFLLFLAVGAIYQIVVWIVAILELFF